MYSADVAHPPKITAPIYQNTLQVQNTKTYFMATRPTVQPNKHV